MLKYDIIILGAGAAGLSLLMRMIDSRQFGDRKILLIDRAPKIANDRTWCFWEKEIGFFENIIHHSWTNLSFHSDTSLKALDIHPYRYKMIRGIDFYNYCFNVINQQTNIDVRYGDVRSVVNNKTEITISTDNDILHCTPAMVFNSFYNSSQSSGDSLQLLQHFKGWFIETEHVYFSNEATLMDFRINQQFGTSFFYVLPLSGKRALVEYTLFTPEILPSEQYDSAIRDYIKKYLNIDRYKIDQEEFGVIPMTNASFPSYHNGMFNIGVVGGRAKPSTGYTFQFIQKQSKAIVDCLISGKPLSRIEALPKRFHFYDSVLLQLLISKQLEGMEIFSRMFEKNKAALIFKFLDNETSVLEELKLISTLQTMPFLKSALRLLNKSPGVR